MSTLTLNSFELLLKRLDPDDQSRAADKYEILRLKLVRCLTWRVGCPESQADDLADRVLDRVAAKLAQGEQIDNMNAYACTVLQYVWKEHIRRHREDAVDDEKLVDLMTVSPDESLLDEPDLRMRCLRKCLVEVVPDQSDRELIITYYDLDAGDKLKSIRRGLAESLGITAVNLKVRAFRIRERLEKCINNCVRKVVTKTGSSITNTWGEGGNE